MTTVPLDGLRTSTWKGEGTMHPFVVSAAVAIATVVPSSIAEANTVYHVRHYATPP